MFEQFFDGFRKASESSVKMQQDALKNWTQQWFSLPNTSPQGSNEWGTAFQKRWLELTVDLLNKHRASLDSAYKSGIQLIEQTFHTTDARSPEEYRGVVEDLWRQLFDTVQSQSDSQLREFQKWAEESFQAAQKKSKAA